MCLYGMWALFVLTPVCLFASLFAHAMKANRAENTMSFSAKGIVLWCNHEVESILHPKEGSLLFFGKDGIPYQKNSGQERKKADSKNCSDSPAGHCCERLNSRTPDLNYLTF